MRRLVCIAGKNEAEIISMPRVSVTMPAGQSFEIIEGAEDTPFGRQFTHVAQAVAEKLATKHPTEWQIVDDAEIRELERIANA